MFGFGKKRRDDLGLDRDMDFGKDDLNLGLDDPMGNPRAPMGMPPQHVPQEYPDLGAGQPSAFNDYRQNQQNERPTFHELGTNLNETPQHPEDSHREFELISAKLDAIKSELDSMNQRLVKIEKLADRELEQQARKRPW
ncbi:MAG: hypothetical protein ABIE94_02155 [archaeon]